MLLSYHCMRKRKCSILASSKGHHKLSIVQVQEAFVDGEEADLVDLGAEEGELARGEVQAVITRAVLHPFDEEGGILVEGQAKRESIARLHCGVLARASHCVCITLSELYQIQTPRRARHQGNGEEKAAPCYHIHSHRFGLAHEHHNHGRLKGEG